MFALSATTRVYLRSDATDLQLSFDGLYALVVGVLKADLLFGHLFYFCKSLDRAEFDVLLHRRAELGGRDARAESLCYALDFTLMYIEALDGDAPARCFRTRRNPFPSPWNR
jgi:hypothetical protein